MTDICSYKNEHQSDISNPAEGPSVKRAKPGDADDVKITSMAYKPKIEITSEEVAFFFLWYLPDEGTHIFA
eukprot:10734460-Karenia_brevis.AAC.1